MTETFAEWYCKRTEDLKFNIVMQALAYTVEPDKDGLARLRHACGSYRSHLHCASKLEAAWAEKEGT